MRWVKTVWPATDSTVAYIEPLTLPPSSQTDLLSRTRFSFPIDQGHLAVGQQSVQKNRGPNPPRVRRQSGWMLKPVAVAQSQGVHPLVRRSQVRVGNMVECEGDAMMVVEGIAEFDGNAKQDS